MRPRPSPWRQNRELQGSGLLVRGLLPAEEGYRKSLRHCHQLECGTHATLLTVRPVSTPRKRIELLGRSKGQRGEKYFYMWYFYWVLIHVMRCAIYRSKPKNRTLTGQHIAWYVNFHFNLICKYITIKRILPFQFPTCNSNCKWNKYLAIKQ